MRIRSALAVLALAPVVGVLPAAPASAHIVFQCDGVSPAIDSCTTTGQLGADPQFTLGLLGVMPSGTVTGTVVTATLTFTVTLTFVNGQVADQDVSQSGYAEAFQSFTLHASATGTGYWVVEVYPN